MPGMVRSASSRTPSITCQMSRRALQSDERDHHEAAFTEACRSR